MYHPAAALRTPAIERESYADMAAVPAALLDARRRREVAVTVPSEGPVEAASTAATAEPATAGSPALAAMDPPGVADRVETEDVLVTEAIEAVTVDGALPAAATVDDAAPQLTLF
jgi:hypothetical protein